VPRIFQHSQLLDSLVGEALARLLFLLACLEFKFQNKIAEEFVPGSAVTTLRRGIYREFSFYH
jgi:hypothetical protein